MTLYHYTDDKGAEAIRQSGEVSALAERLTEAQFESVVPWARGALLLSWFTDLDYPFRDQLGLTQKFIETDRTRHRFRVTDPTSIIKWTHVRRRFTLRFTQALEDEPGSMPAHWYIAIWPTAVPVVYDPIPAPSSVIL